MNLGNRFFVVDGESVVRLTQKSFNEFFFRKSPAFPGYAATTLVVAMVIYELKDRKPDRVVRIDVHRFKVNSDGSMDRSYFGEGMKLAFSRGFGREEGSASIRSISNVIDATELFDERRWKQHHPEIGGPALKKILTNLFGTSNAGEYS